MKRRQFTDREKEFIFQFAGKKSGTWMAKKLQASYCMVYRFMDAHGLKRIGSSKALSISWTPEMLEILRNEFPVSYNRKLAAKLKVSMRSLIRKARELHIEKEPGFLDKRRKEITHMATINHGVPWNKGLHYTPLHLVPFQHKPGQRPNRDYKAQGERLQELYRRDRLRMKYGLPRLTKKNLKP